MSFFQVKKDEAVLEEFGGEWIKQSGIYDCTIKTVSVKTNQHGARSLNFNMEYKGSPFTLYGLKLDNNNGSPNFQRDIFNRLCVIAGVDTVNEPEMQTHLLGRDKVPTELAVLTEFSDLDVKVRVQYVYSVYNGEIKENREIKAFYRASDGASAYEITKNADFGVQLQKDTAYANNTTYKDGLTKEQVDAWKADKSSQPAQTAKPQPANPFADDNPF